MDKKTIEMLWEEFGDVPTTGSGEIDEPFCGWERLTEVNEIWHWFDDQYARYGGVHALMFPDEAPSSGTSRFGRVMAYVDLQAWSFDYAISLDYFDFDCSLALDGLPIGFVERLQARVSNDDVDEVFVEAMDIGLVKKHDGPFHFYILDENELLEYVLRRKNGA